MTCKLARKKKKQLNLVVKDELFFKKLFGFSSNIIRSHTNKITELAKRYMFLPNKRYKYYNDYNRIEYMYGNKNISIEDINYEMLYIVPSMCTSVVKRSRIKDIVLEYAAISLDQYNHATGSTENPVSMYYKIMSNTNDL